MTQLVDPCQHLRVGNRVLIRIDDRRFLGMRGCEGPELRNPHGPYASPRSLAAFSFRIRGLTSSRNGAASKSAIQRSAVIIGWSEPNNTLFLSRVLAYCTSSGGKYFGDHPERSIKTCCLCSAMAK